MNTPAPSGNLNAKASAVSAFTLIELLVVISIIAVLAGLLLPVVGSVTENAKKTEAKSTEMQIVSAVKNFQTEYGVYPVPTGTTATNDLTFGGSAGHNQSLFDVLRSIDANSTTAPSPNSRRIVYFEGKDAKNINLPKSGFVPSTATAAKDNTGLALNVGDLVDSWGNQFYVRYDTGYSDALVNPFPATNGGPNTGTDESDTTKVIRFGAVSWSPGKDGKMGTPTVTNSNYGQDDVVSWQ